MNNTLPNGKKKYLLCDNCGEVTKPYVDKHINYMNLHVNKCECGEHFITCTKCSTHKLCNTCNRELKIEIIIEHE